MEPASGVVVVPDEEQVGLIEEALGIEINQPVERAERRREAGREGVGIARNAGGVMAGT